MLFPDRKEGTAYSILRDYVKDQDPRNKLFIHPITRKLMEFETPVPASFASMVK